MVTIGIIHTDRPGVDYLSKVEDSLDRSDWVGDLLLYEDHDRKLGCFGNFNRALKDLIEVSETDYILVSSDDMVFSRNWLSVLIKKIKSTPPFGFLSLYTPFGMTYYHKTPSGS